MAGRLNYWQESRVERDAGRDCRIDFHVLCSSLDLVIDKRLLLLNIFRRLQTPHTQFSCTLHFGYLTTSHYIKTLTALAVIYRSIQHVGCFAARREDPEQPSQVLGQLQI